MSSVSPTCDEAAPALPSVSTPTPIPTPDATAERRRRRRRCLLVLERIKTTVEGSKRGYDMLREVTLKIHEWLNEDGVIAPAFRPLIARQKFPCCGTGLDVGTLIFHDQMRIDLHWLLVHGCTARSFEAKEALSAIKRHGIDAPGAKVFLSLPRKMKARVADLELNHARRWECIWLSSQNARMLRAELLKRRDANIRRLKDELRTTSVGGKKASLSRVSIEAICNVALAWDIGLLRDPKLTATEHARLYRLVTGDDEVTRHSIRHQREQVRQYIPSCGSVPAVRGRPIR